MNGGDTPILSGGRLGWWNDWRNPFLWVILTPIVTVPLSALLFVVLVGTHDGSEVGLPDDSLPPPCIIDCPEYSAYTYLEVTPTVRVLALPGLVAIVAFAWVFSKKPGVRIASIVAGLLGLLWLSAPSAALMFSTRLTGAGGASHFQYAYDPDPFFDLGLLETLSEPLAVLFVLGIGVWTASLLAFSMTLFLAGFAAGRAKLPRSNAKS